MNQDTLQNINTYVELERIGWKYEPCSDEEIRCKCPAHNDKHPSCFINVKKNLFQCKVPSCGAKGDLVTFLALALKTNRPTIYADLAKRYDVSEIKSISSDIIEKYHTTLKHGKKGRTLVDAIYKKGIIDEDIVRYRIGYDPNRNRITIPIRNNYGSFVNIRRYLPNAPNKNKMSNVRGHGKIRLFPIDQTDYKRIMVCGGEIKAIVAAHLLNPHDIGAVCTTGGEGNWENEFSEFFRDKVVYICFDIDNEGRKGAMMVATRLLLVAKSVRIIELPLDKEKYPHGDINDWVGAEKANEKDLLKLIENTEVWKPTDFEKDPTKEDQSKPVETKLDDSTKPDLVGKPITITGVVSAIDTSPYLVPKKVKCICEKDQKYCFMCPVFAKFKQNDTFVELTIQPKSAHILEYINVGKKEIRETTRKCLRIPICKTVEFHPISHYSIEDIRLNPCLDIDSLESNKTMIPAYSISHGLELNTPYNFTGYTYPHPKSQQAIFLAKKNKASQDSLDTFNPSDEDLSKLLIFQPKNWNYIGLDKKLNEIYDDLEDNVTRIFMRKKLHLVCDLVYHSVLFFSIEDNRLEKGWVEALVLGDSAQGKTETSKRLMEYYKLGVRVECKNASTAGLLGGVQSLGGNSRWFVTWGIIPTHDRRLVILEELKGASVEVISKLTDMRSSGVAEIPKIEKRKTFARTRLLAISNPRKDMPISTYSYGIYAIKELIGSLEDVRRFDMGLIVSAEEIDQKFVNNLSANKSKHENIHTSDLCRNLILWAWTRKPYEILIDESIKKEITFSANKLCEEYTDIIPLVDRGSMRLKIARLSIALAARTFSCDEEDYHILVVRKCHVEYITRLLEKIYSSKIFGYKDMTTSYKLTLKLKDPDIIKKHILGTPYPSDFIDNLLFTNNIDVRDIQDWCGWERSVSSELISLLVRKRAITREGIIYHKNPAFIEFLRDLKDSDDLKIVDRPKYIKEEDEEI